MSIMIGINAEHDTAHTNKGLRKTLSPFYAYSVIMGSV